MRRRGWGRERDVGDLVFERTVFSFGILSDNENIDVWVTCWNNRIRFTTNHIGIKIKTSSKDTIQSSLSFLQGHIESHRRRTFNELLVFCEEMFPRWSSEESVNDERKRRTFQGDSVSSDCSDRSFEHFITGDVTWQRNIFKIHRSSNTSNQIKSVRWSERKFCLFERTESLLWHVPSIQVRHRRHEWVSRCIFLRTLFSTVYLTREQKRRQLHGREAIRVIRNKHLWRWIDDGKQTSTTLDKDLSSKPRASFTCVTRLDDQLLRERLRLRLRDRQTENKQQRTSLVDRGSLLFLLVGRGRLLMLFITALIFRRPMRIFVSSSTLFFTL